MDNQQDIDYLTEYIQQFDYVAYDCETTGLSKTHEVIGFSICTEEDKACYVILQKWEGSQLVDLQLNVSSLLKTLQTKQLIMHNGVYDCKMAEAYFKINLIDSLHTDTMVLAHLLDENRRVGLKELAKFYFGEDAAEEQRLMKESVAANGGKITKDHFELYKADSQLLAKYGAQDALLTFKLFNTLVPELFEQGLDKFFYEEETMPLLKGPTYQLNTVGLKVDAPYLTNLKKQLEAECLEARAFIKNEISAKISAKYPGTKKSNTFNIGSNQQLSWLLFGEYGLEFGSLTKEGKTVAKALIGKTPYTLRDKKHFIAACLHSESNIHQPEATVNGKKVRAKKVKSPWAYIAADKDILKKYAPKYAWIAKLLELKQKSKILDTYLIGIEERVQYGIINPSFLQHGTTSGRYASRDPNFQNLPRDDKRVKKCLIARPGKVFVGADYSQLEPRVFAYYSQDERLMKVFNGTDDFYSAIGMEVYNKHDCLPIKEGSPDAFGIKYKKLRDLSKVIALASTYGASAWQLMKTTGKSEQDTQQDIDNYFEAFPGVKGMMLEAHNLAKTEGQVTNLFGRPRRMPEAKRITKLYGNKEHSELPYDARSLLNLAVNHRIQSTGASIVNRASIAFYNDCKAVGIDCQLIAQVHDSLVVECNEKDAEDVVALLQNAMENTVELKGVPLEAQPKIGYNLAEV